MTPPGVTTPVDGKATRSGQLGDCRIDRETTGRSERRRTARYIGRHRTMYRQIYGYAWGGVAETTAEMKTQTKRMGCGCREDETGRRRQGRFSRQRARERASNTRADEP